ncbi:unnamed protein product, partial [Ectocarpus sp. 12 AP-2014]
PQTGGERELRVKVEGGWKLSASFPVDSVGEYTLRLTRQVDVSKLKHISTRRSSEYDVVIPQMEDVGIWLETDWYRKQAVIKEIKKDSYAFTSTDIHVGDALIAINNVSVQGVPFSSIMQSMKKSLREDPCIVLRFRTMEERYRLLRMKALRRKLGGRNGFGLSSPGGTSSYLWDDSMRGYDGD